MFAFFIPGVTESLLLLVLLGITIALVLPFWMICTKVGLPGWFSLAVFVPVLNILFLYYLAFVQLAAMRKLIKLCLRDSA